MSETQTPAAAKAELLVLAERVEALTGPDRSADCWIENHLGLARFVPDRPAPFGEGWLDKRVEPKPYTTSLDAALSLVPEGLFCSVCQQVRTGKWRAWINAGLPGKYGRVRFKQISETEEAATPALALTAAALRARAAQ